MKVKTPGNSINKYAFTLLEMLIATTIFAIVIASIYQTFRTGIFAYNRGHRSVELLQNARFAMNLITKDIRCIYYKNESEYNNNFQDLLKTQPNLFEPDNKTPYEFGLQIDLAFLGKNGNDKDQISFVKKQYNDGKLQIEPWSLARIEYSIEKNNLVRTMDDVVLPQLDELGKELEESNEPEKDIVAFNVKKFDVKYIYYYNYAWRVVEDWNSGDKKYKNPETAGIDEKDPDWSAYKAMRDTIPDDELPSALEVTISIADSEQEKRVYTYSFLVGVPSAREVWIKQDETTSPFKSKNKKTSEPTKYFGDE